MLMDRRGIREDVARTKEEGVMRRGSSRFVKPRRTESAARRELGEAWLLERCSERVS
jgi:hypothetical protein